VSFGLRASLVDPARWRAQLAWLSVIAALAKYHALRDGAVRQQRPVARRARQTWLEIQSAVAPPGGTRAPCEFMSVAVSGRGRGMRAAIARLDIMRYPWSLDLGSERGSRPGWTALVPR
jgi:hypothetical protein